MRGLQQQKRPVRTVETRIAIASTYEGFECAVIADGCEASDWFKIKSGVKQECVMSGFLFLLAMKCRRILIFRTTAHFFHPSSMNCVRKLGD